MRKRLHPRWQAYWIVIYGLLLSLGGGGCSDPVELPEEVCANSICPSEADCRIGRCNPENGACEQDVAANGTECSIGGCWNGMCRTTQLLLTVLDVEGNPLAGAGVSWNKAQYSTDEFGRLAVNGRVSSGRSVAVISAAGFANATAQFDGVPGSREDVVVRLLPLSVPVIIDPTKPAQVRIDGVSVELPPDSIVDTHGTAVTGPVGVTIVALDPTRKDLLAARPGPLIGVPASGAETDLATIFMAEISLWRGNEALQLKPGATARLTLPVPSSMQKAFMANEPVSAWWFDVELGRWREEGAGTLRSVGGALVWVAEVAHFTWWNVDYPLADTTSLANLNCLDVRVVADGMVLDDVKVTTTTENIDIRGLSVDEKKTADLGMPGGARACVNALRGSISRVRAAKSGYTQTEIILDAPPPMGYEAYGSAQSGLLRTNATASSCTTPSPSCARATINMVRDACLRIVMTGSLAPGNVVLSYNDGGGITSQVVQIGVGGTECVSVPRLADLRLRVTRMKAGYTLYGESMPIDVTGVTSSACAPSGMTDTCKSTTLDTDTFRGCTPAGPCAAQWAGLHGDGSAQELRALYASAQDPNGEFYIGGQFKGTLTLPSAPRATCASLRSLREYAPFVAKMDRNGLCLWVRGFGSFVAGQINSLALDSMQRLVVAGVFSGTLAFPDLMKSLTSGDRDSFVAKFDTGGSALWAEQLSGPGDQLAEVVQAILDPSTGQEAIGILGSFQNTIRVGTYAPTSNGGDDLFVALFSTNGTPIFLEHAGGLGNERITAGGFADAGRILVAGTYDQDFTLAGARLAHRGALDGFVAQVRYEPIHRLFFASWALALQEPTGQPATDQVPTALLIKPTANGDIIVAGSFGGQLELPAAVGGPFTSNGGSDIFVTQLSGVSGVPAWVRTFGAPGNQVPTSLAWLGGERVAMAGTLENAVQFVGGTPAMSEKGAVDAFIVGLDVSASGAGKARSQHRYGGAGGTMITPLLAGSNMARQLILGATFGGSGTAVPDVGPPLVRGGDNDILLAGFDISL